MEGMTFEEFSEQICKKRGEKKMKITNSLGAYDMYKHMRKQHWYDIGRPLKEGEYYAIIRKVNTLLADNITKGETVTFPSRMGKLELRKFKTGARIVNGKLKVTYPVDWNETLKLWYTDEEARQNKTLVRDESGTGYKVKYDKWDATYENKGFYQFELNRFVRRRLKKNIYAGITDTLYGK